MNRLDARPAAEEKLVEVPLLTLDELLQKNFGTGQDGFVDVCKIDVEGRSI